MGDKEDFEAKRAAIETAVEKVTQELMDQGRIIEAGFRAMISFAYLDADPPMQKDQEDELRAAFFAGAQHLWGSIMCSLDPGEEPTEDDERRFALIQSELDTFIADFRKSHGIESPPQPQQ